MSATSLAAGLEQLAEQARQRLRMVEDTFLEGTETMSLPVPTVAALVEVAQAAHENTAHHNAIPRLRAALAGLAGRLGGVQAGTEGER